MFANPPQAFRQRMLPLLLALGVLSPAHAWIPGTADPTAVGGFSVDVSSRSDVLSFHNCVFLASANYPATLGWTGNVPTGQPGTTTSVFKNDVLRRVNYYRALAGLPADLTLDATKSAKCQRAALIMSANRNISHYPPANWLFYNAAGYEAASSSNLALGTYGPAAVDGYMTEYGNGNHVVGHRRWLLYPAARVIGTGDLPATGTYLASNCLWVIDDFPPAPAPEFTAWPYDGYVPAPIMPARWSLSYPGANFSGASVHMSFNGVNVPLTIVSRNDDGYGDNTLVWQPVGIPANVIQDLAYTVTVSGIAGAGVPSSTTYTVRLFNPDLLGESVAITGPDQASAAGQGYTFNSIAAADAYQLEVASTAPTSWTEGAEHATASHIQGFTSWGYALRQSRLKRSGQLAFQLAHPPRVFADQSFVIHRDIIPTAASRLLYFDRARWTARTATLETQVSLDGGTSWFSIFRRTGVNRSGSSSEWDRSWKFRNLSLAPFAGQVIKLRFIMKRNRGGVYPGTSPNHGFFVDDIQVTAATYIANSSITTLPAGTTSFTLDSTTAGTELVPGSRFDLRIRPNVGNRWFGFGARKSITVVAPPPARIASAPPVPGFATWAAGWENDHSLPPGTLAGPNEDFDHDGRPNLIEYAFGASPVTPGDAPPGLPVHYATATHFVLEYQVDSALADLSITPQAGTHPGDWKSPGEPGAPAGFSDDFVSTIGTIQTRRASVPLSSGACFLRIRVTR